MADGVSWTVPVAVHQVSNSAEPLNLERDHTLDCFGGDYKSGSGGNNTVTTTHELTRKDGSTAKFTLASRHQQTDYGYHVKVTVTRTLTTFADEVVGIITIRDL
jgi:hypothetical protein